MKQVTITPGKSFKLSPSSIIGEGGEAVVYKVNDTTALKLFKQPDHISFQGQPRDQKAAKDRLLEHQTKLQQFPANLPRGVVAPIDLATHNRVIVGYTMHFLAGMEVLLRYGERKYRESSGITDAHVVAIFRHMHETLMALHRAGVVVGDFNDLNVLVDNTNKKPYLIDADSMQFGNFKCKVFTGKFVDPLLCDPQATSPLLVKPHTEQSDWYAFNVMLFNCLLYVGPYGGVYRPKDKNRRMTHDARPLRRVTVFDAEVRYPKPAKPVDALPKDVLAHFARVFKEDQRLPFPEALLASLEASCAASPDGTLTGQKSPVVAPAVSQVVRGSVTARRIFRTSGRVRHVTFLDKLRWVYHEDGAWKREDGEVVIKGEMDPKLRFRIYRENTIIAKDDKAVVMSPHVKPHTIAVDKFGELPIIESTAIHFFWLEGGALKRNNNLPIDGFIMSQEIGRVVENRTLFWVGEKFGFGLSRAGSLAYYFVFDSRIKGALNDKVKIPAIRGNLIDAQCYFAGNLAWFMYSSREGSKIVNRCYVINDAGQVEAEAEATQGDDTWLGSIRGRCAVSKFLFVPTDDGIVRVDSSNIHSTKEFPDTSTVVDSGCQLFPGNKGLTVVKSNEIWELELA